VQAQDDLKISGCLEIWADMYSSADYDVFLGGAAETQGLTQQEVDLSIKLEKQLGEGVKLTALLDCEDTSTDALIEEAYVTWAKALGEKVDLTFGRKELKFGQDFKMWESEYILHDYAEVDNAFVLEFGIEASDMVKVYVSNWQANAGSFLDDDNVRVSNDNFMLQSFALKAEIKAVENLMVSVSYLNEHDEEMLTAANEADGLIPNQTRISVAATYTDSDMGLKVFFEYLMLTALDTTLDRHVEGHNGSVMQVGAKLALDPEKKFEVGLAYEGLTAEVDNSDNAADGTKTNTTALTVGFAYNVTPKNPVVLEYVMLNDVENELALNVITVGTIVKF
jgi:hypothetical protein